MATHKRFDQLPILLASRDALDLILYDFVLELGKSGDFRHCPEVSGYPQVENRFGPEDIDRLLILLLYIANREKMDFLASFASRFLPIQAITVSSDCRRDAMSSSASENSA